MLDPVGENFGESYAACCKLFTVEKFCGSVSNREAFPVK